MNKTYLKNEDDSKIIEINNFISEDFSDKLSKHFELSNHWENVGFYNAKVLMNMNLTDNLLYDWNDILKKIKQLIEDSFFKNVTLQQVYVQKWPVGSYGVKHNDTHNYDGTSANLNYKIATILFLCNDFTGGELEFPDQNILIFPKQKSLYIFDGGQKNEHKVLEIKSGLRYTIIAFWDFEGSTYTEEEEQNKKKFQDRWKQYVKKNEVNNNE